MDHTFHVDDERQADIDSGRVVLLGMVFYRPSNKAVEFDIITTIPIPEAAAILKTVIPGVENRNEH